jgi:hypothetical protein
MASANAFNRVEAQNAKPVYLRAATRADSPPVSRTDSAGLVDCSDIHCDGDCA